jgi:hypothetical protein
MDIIQNEIDYYKKNRLEFIEQYGGKHLVIKDMAIAGIYDTRSQANEAGVLLQTGTFIIEHPVDISLARTPSKKVTR